MKHIHTFEEFLNESRINEREKTWTVVSQDAHGKKWGIEGDFEADDEDDAIELGQAQAIKYKAKRSMFHAFLANSKELEDFMDDHDFID